jgi:hypothetical protein
VHLASGDKVDFVYSAMLHDTRRQEISPFLWTASDSSRELSVASAKTNGDRNEIANWDFRALYWKRFVLLCEY